MDSTESRDLLVEQILREDLLGDGPKEPQVILASSAAALTKAMDAIGGITLKEGRVEVPDLGDGTYLAAFWGYKPSPGFSVVVESALLEGDQVRVHLALLGEMQPEELITYPFAVALIRDVDPNEKNFSFEAFVENLEWRQYSR